MAGVGRGPGPHAVHDRHRVAGQRLGRADYQGAVLVRGRGDVRHREQRLRDAGFHDHAPAPSTPAPPTGYSTRTLIPGISWYALTGRRTQPREMGSGRAVSVVGTGRGVVRGRGMVRGRSVAGFRPRVRS